jgi:protein O-GlcNAc transferase
MTNSTSLLQFALQQHRAGNLPQAEQIYRQILTVEPGHAQAWHFLGVVAQQSGQHDAALDAMQRALALAPGEAVFHCNLGPVYIAQGRLEDALACYDRALQIRPEYTEAHYNRGNVLRSLGRSEEAIASYQRAIQLNPQYADAHSNLGVYLAEQGRLNEAVVCFREAIRLQPNFVQARYNLGNALRELGQLPEAIASYRETVWLDPNYADAYVNLATALRDHGEMGDAIASLHKALQLRPNDAVQHNNLGNVYIERGNLAEGAKCLQESLRIKPDYAESYNNLGVAWHLQARIDEAAASYREALKLKPDYVDAHSNLVFALNYHPDIDQTRLLAEHRGWAESQAAGISPYASYENSRDPERTLRVGYVSPDFRRHPVAFFMEPVLHRHDRQVVESFCYAQVASPDAYTERLKAAAGNWLNTCGMTDEQLAEQIRADRIDILVDLAGHTAKNRLLVFARKPAPVQVSYLGYPNTTGLAAIDYRLTDTVADPVDEPPLYVERLIRMSAGLCCYRPFDDTPAVSPLPSRERGYITFGSTHSLAKLNSRVMEWWGRILSEMPNARLLVCRNSLTGATKDYFREQFAEHGCDIERVEFRGGVTLGGDKHWPIYSEIDISLDAFPWCGHTTACESLWMGVPIVTLYGDRHAGRMVASVLTSLGMTDWIARTPDDYVALAVRMAHDRQRLTELRANLRQRMRESPLCDGQTFTRGMEAAYREMWKEWCARDSDR